MANKLQQIAGAAKSIQYQMDQMWNKGKEEKWPKEVMDWLMWYEHEVSRSTWYIGKLVKDLEPN